MEVDGGWFTDAVWRHGCDMSVVCVYARVCVRGGGMREVCCADEDASNDDYEPVMLRDGGSIKKREKRKRKKTKRD